MPFFHVLYFLSLLIILQRLSPFISSSSFHNSLLYFLFSCFATLTTTPSSFHRRRIYGAQPRLGDRTATMLCCCCNDRGLIPISFGIVQYVDYKKTNTYFPLHPACFIFWKVCKEVYNQYQKSTKLNYNDHLNET